MTDLIEKLKRHEGYRAKPYQCSAGVWTFGYGCTSVTPEEAEFLLMSKVVKLQDTLRATISGLSKPRQDVIINMAYNLGIGGLMRFRRMWAAIYRGDYETAADEMLDSAWARQVGARAIELSEVMRKGE